MGRRTKKGFTLTEVLLAMSIIGVISALVMPQLVKTIQKDRAGMILGKAVEQIELGCQNMIQAYNESMEDSGRTSMADTLMALDGDYTYSFNRLAPYIGATNITQADNGPILSRTSQYRFNKFPAEIQIPSLRLLWIAGHKFTLDDIIETQIIIDVNGLEKRPNELGKDRFRFDLRNDGKLVPAGLNSNSCDGNNPTIDANCTARVVKDGFKIKYNW